jgi:hypothetical protein
MNRRSATARQWRRQSRRLNFGAGLHPASIATAKKRCEQPVGVTQFEIDRAPQNHANSLFRATAAIDCVS